MALVAGFHPSAFLLHPLVGGCSSVGIASAFQAEGREFESRRPLQNAGQVVKLVIEILNAAG